MKNIDFESIRNLLWLFFILGASLVLARILNPHGIPDEPPASNGFVSEAVILLIVLVSLFIAAYGLRGAWRKTKEYFKLPLVGKLEKLFIGLLILFNPFLAIPVFMLCVVTGKCGVYSALFLIYFALYFAVMASYYVILKIKNKSQYDSPSEARQSHE